MAEFIPIEHQIVVRSLFGQAYGGARADRLAAATKEHFFPAGKTIYEAGDTPKYVHFIVQGRVELTAEGLDPWSFEDRGVVGILDAELARPHARTARAVTDVRVISIRAEDWEEVVEDTFDYTKQRITLNARDLVRRGLLLAPHAGFEGMPEHHRADDVPPVEASGEYPFERLLVLHLTDLFERASIQALIRIADAARERELDSGEVLIEQGAPAPASFIVANGLLEMKRDEPRISAGFGVNRLLGGYAGIGQATWPATFVARQPSRVIEFGQEDLFDVMEDHFSVVRSVMRFLALERDRLQTFKW
jgi:CRP-like cAMP-binding protein